MLRLLKDGNCYPQIWKKKKTDDADFTKRLPALSQREVCEVKSGELNQLETKPPQHYTDGTLIIAAMKNASAFVTDLRRYLR
ncbi:DNA topoisomerase [Xenorhabdus miraniensis]|uniref:DNA topoisomerase n=1 Tax=Xenorhabdus miraniensis TaxID=351674 RepID=A0A2D0JUU6_9GAMM|nr:DNA topoisomerase [Xenorhabdus miraniensis]